MSSVGNSLFKQLYGLVITVVSAPFALSANLFK
ncbi:Uncharacterised protein [Corynebacterium minutissimum]|uniref:Uncharacterized protein n=1 Tax=Corynebacterium minutissimum TaxID=38301 RepID=A0A2X4RPR6_9CORY|nr:Uncharacterised protein [Corynebacterium minutissimum]VEG04984.1 Uncharacterised protein [Corynebacterium minutissimum]